MVSLHSPVRSSRRRGAVALASVLLAVLSLVASPEDAHGATVVGHRAQSFAGWNATANGAATGEKPESKLWYHDGAWWASLVQPATGAHTIHVLVGDTWWDTGTVVDGSPIAKEDTLVIGNRLYVTTRGTWQLRRFSYVDGGPGAGDGSWALDAGFPVRLPVSSAEALTIARDTTGMLWLTWTQNDDVRVAHTTGSDTTWSSSFILPSTVASGISTDDIAGIVAFQDANGPAVGVMWSDQKRMVQHFAVHRDGAAPDSWSFETALSGPQEADDHINLKVFEGRVYAAVKTGHNSAADPLIRLLVRSTTGRWTAHPVARYDEHDTRPIVTMQVDPAQRRIYVVMTRNMGGGRNGIVYKSSSIDGVGFPTTATTLIDSGTTSINDPTSMKANATAASGIVVLASDTTHYWWNRIGGTAPPPASEVTLSTSVVGQGSVVLDPPGGTYAPGTEVTLTAQPASGWTFTGWSGALTGATTPTSLVVQADASVTATFLQDTGGGGGTGTVALAQTVTGTATSSSSVSTSTAVAADPGQVYLASVATKPSREVTSLTGLGLTWTRVALQCSGRDQTAVAIWIGSGTPTSGTVTATLTGTPQAVLAISGYTGVDRTTPIGTIARANSTGPGSSACSGGSDGTSYDLTVPTTTADGLVHGAVAMRSSGHDPAGATIEDTETQAGSGGNAAGLATTHTPVTTPTTRLTGTFSGSVDWAVLAVTLRAGDGSAPPPPPPGDVTLSTSVVGQGSVVLDPPGGTYAPGTEVTLTAQPASGWTFTGWSGALTGATTPTSLVVQADASVTATFLQDTGGGGGTGTVALAQTVTGTATSSSSVSTSTAVAADPGQVYLASVATKPSREVTSLTGLGLTWTRVALQCSGRDQTAVAIWIGSGTPTSGTVTATLTGTPQAVLAISGYTGVDRTTPIGTIARANSTGPGSSACSGGSDGTSYDLTVPTTTADGLVHGAVAMRFRGHDPAGATIEDTETQAGSGGNAAGLATTHTPVTTPTTRLTGTFSGSVDWAVLAVTLRAGATP